MSVHSAILRIQTVDNHSIKGIRFCLSQSYLNIKTCQEDSFCVEIITGNLVETKKQF